MELINWAIIWLHVENPLAPPSIRPNHSIQSYMFSMPYACGGLKGPLLALFLSLDIIFFLVCLTAAWPTFKWVSNILKVTEPVGEDSS